MAPPYAPPSAPPHAPPHYAHSVASTHSTQPLDDDWDRQSISSYYPSTETPFTISGSEAGSILPYTVSRPSANAKPAYSTLTPFTLTPLPSNGGLKPNPAVPYGVPVQPQPQALNLTYPNALALQNIQPYPGQVVQNFPGQLPQGQPVPAQLPQAYPVPGQWPQPLGATYPGPERIGAATAYFPASPASAPQPQFYPLAEPVEPQWQRPQSLPGPTGAHWFSAPPQLTRPQSAPEPHTWSHPPPASHHHNHQNHQNHHHHHSQQQQHPHSAPEKHGLRKRDVAGIAALVLGGVAMGALLAN